MMCAAALVVTLIPRTNPGAASPRSPVVCPFAVLLWGGETGHEVRL